MRTLECARWIRRGRWLGIPWLLVGCLALTAWPYAGRAQEETQRFPILVRVDFGPAGKPVREEQFMVDEGSTAKDAVSLLFPVRSGAMCCNTRELAAIDEVWSDPASNTWWTCRINGSTKIGPFRTELKPNDTVEWVYIAQSQ